MNLEALFETYIHVWPV